MAEVHNPPPLPPTARAGGRGARRSGGADPRRRHGAALSRCCWRFGACSWPNTTPVGGDAPGPIGPRLGSPRSSPLLTDEQVASLTRRGTHHHTTAGEVLDAAGERGYDVIVIEAGEVDVLRPAMPNAPRP
jgi:hypothetical protein